MRVLICISVLFLFTEVKAQSDWVLVTQEPNIEVYTQKSSGFSIKEVRIKARIQCDMSELVAALEDVDNHKKWVLRTIESKFIDKTKPDTFTYYVSTDFPFPTKDRDIAIYYERKYNPTNGQVFTRSIANANAIPKYADFIRMDEFESTYLLKPENDGYISIDYYVKASPSGWIPNWMVNLAITKGPIYSINKLFNLINEGFYTVHKLNKELDWMNQEIH